MRPFRFGGLFARGGKGGWLGAQNGWSEGHRLFVGGEELRETWLQAVAIFLATYCQCIAVDLVLVAEYILQCCWS